MSSLFSAILKTGAGTLLAILFSVATGKIIAIEFGPTGIGAYSLVRQFVVTFSFFGAGCQSAVLRGSVTRSPNQRAAFLRSALRMYLVGTAFVVTVILTLSAFSIPSIRFDIFSSHPLLLVTLATTTAVANLYYFFRAVLNSLHLLGRLAVVEALGPLLVLVLIYPALHLNPQNHATALTCVIGISQVGMITLSSFYIFSEGSLPNSLLSVSSPIGVPREEIYDFLKFSAFAIMATIAGGVSLLTVRTSVAGFLGVASAGIFDLAWTIGGAYVMLIVGAFGTYYLPKLASERSPEIRTALVINVFRVSSASATLLIIALIASQNFIIKLLYSAEFLPATHLLRWMLIGSFFKIGAWALSIPTVARGKMAIYFATELVWWSAFCAASYILIRYFHSLECVVVTATILYIALLAFYIYYETSRGDLCIRPDERRLWLSGLGCILAATWIEWNSTGTHWIRAFFVLTCALAILWAAITKDERSALMRAFRACKSMLFSQF